jgi:hypothetical protein
LVEWLALGHRNLRNMVEGGDGRPWTLKNSQKNKPPKTYNTRDSLVVIDPTTDLALLLFVC